MEICSECLPPILSFGPEHAPSGVPFNVQPGGESGFWLRMAEQPPRETVVVFGGTSLQTSVSDHLVTALVPTHLTQRAGLIPVWLEAETADSVRFSAPVYFESVPDAKELPAVEAHGPVETPRGQPFNAQADGHSWLWVRVAGRPPSATIVVCDGIDLSTRIDGQVIAAMVPPELLTEARALPVQLALDSAAGRQLSPVFVMTVV